MKALFLLVTLLLVGCMTNKHDAAIEQARYEFALKAQESANRPLLILSCPAGGCVFSSLAVHNPNAKMPALPRDTNAYDVASVILNTGKDVALGVAPWLITGKIAVEGIKNAGTVLTNSQNDNSTSGSHNDHSSRSSVANQDHSNHSDNSSYEDSSDHSSHHQTSNQETADSYNTASSNVQESYNTATETSTVTDTRTETTSTNTNDLSDHSFVGNGTSE